MMSSPPAWTRLVRLSANGASDSLSLDCLALRRSLEEGVKPAFPPSLVVEVKALACELPIKLGLPLSCSRFVPTHLGGRFMGRR
jgi:hypothetical protein